MRYTKIVSLTPSITETLFALGCGDRVVGVTDACDFPPEVSGKPHVYSWVDPSIDRIKALDPDLVLGLETAHSRLIIPLQLNNISCHLFNPQTINEVLEDIIQLGSLLDTTPAALLLVKALEYRLKTLDTAVKTIATGSQLTVSRVLDIDGDTLIVAGPLSFQYDVIARAGGINVTTAETTAYPKVTFQQFKEWDPEMIFICGTDSSYLTRLENDPRWQSLRAVRNSSFYQFDCGLTCRTSPRIVDMAELLFTTLYKEFSYG